MAKLFASKLGLRDRDNAPSEEIRPKGDAVTMVAACGAGIEYAQGDQIGQEDIVMEDTFTTCTPILPLNLAG